MSIEQVLDVALAVPSTIALGYARHFECVPTQDLIGDKIDRKYCAMVSSSAKLARGYGTGM